MISSSQKNGPHTETDAIPKSAPQVEPKAIGLGHPEYNFVQGLMALERSAAKTDARIEHLEKTVDETKTKVSRIEKTIYIATGVIVFAVVVGGWMANSLKDVAMLYVKASIDAQQTKAASPQIAPAQTQQKTTP